VIEKTPRKPFQARGTYDNDCIANSIPNRILFPATPLTLLRVATANIGSWI
ncbi:unnamed protein product, partial [Acidithrix sp. C25]